jgi:hypothetical protein
MDQLDSLLAAQASQASSTPSNDDSIDALLAARAQGKNGEQATLSKSIMDRLADAGDAVLQAPVDAQAAFGHHIGNFLHGTANLVEKGLAAGANKIAPNSAAAKYLQDVANADQSAVQKREADYQASQPDSAGTAAGAIGGTIAPFVVGGSNSLANLTQKAGDTVAKVPQLLNKVGLQTVVGNTAGKIASGATQGGLMGATAPITSGDASDYWSNVLNNVKAGSLTGGAISAGGQALKALSNAGQAAYDTVSPLVSSDARMQKVAQFLKENIGMPTEDAVNALSNVKEYVPGSQPTTAQALGDGRLLSLERSAKNTQPFATQFQDLSNKNNELRVNALNDLAGTNGKYAEALKTRGDAASNLYKDAMQSGIDQKALTPEVKASMDSLLQRPSMQTAMSAAEKNAAEAGMQSNSGITLDKLDSAKKNLDDQIEANVRAGNNNAARLLMGTKTELDNLMATVSPKYALARDTFAQNSKPLNQMEQVQNITHRLVAPNGTTVVPTDVSGIPQLTRANLAAGLRKVDPSVVTPEQMAALKNVEADVNRADLTNTSQRLPGSNTPQDLTNIDMVNSLLGKSNYLSKVPVISSAAKSLNEGAANDMQKKLAQLLIDPAAAKDALSNMTPANRRLIQSLLADPAVNKAIQAAPQVGGYVFGK